MNMNSAYDKMDTQDGSLGEEPVNEQLQAQFDDLWNED